METTIEDGPTKESQLKGASVTLFIEPCRWRI